MVKDFEDQDRLHAFGALDPAMVIDVLPGALRVDTQPCWFGPPFPVTVISVDVDEPTHPKSLPA